MGERIAGKQDWPSLIIEGGRVGCIIIQPPPSQKAINAHFIIVMYFAH